MGNKGPGLLNSQVGCELPLIKWKRPLWSPLLWWHVTGATRGVSAAVVYFPSICCNLEDIDWMPCPTRACLTDMDCLQGELNWCWTLQQKSSTSLKERWNKWMLDEPPWQGHSSLSSSRYLKHGGGGGSAPLIFFPSVSAAAVCHSRQVCVHACAICMVTSFE